MVGVRHDQIEDYRFSLHLCGTSGWVMRGREEQLVPEEHFEEHYSENSSTVAMERPS